MLWKEITLSIVLEIVELKITFCSVWWLQILHLFPFCYSIIFKLKQVLRFCLKKPKEEEGCISYSCSIKLEVPWACSLTIVTWWLVPILLNMLIYTASVDASILHFWQRSLAHSNTWTMPRNCMEKCYQKWAKIWPRSVWQIWLKSSSRVSPTTISTTSIDMPLDPMNTSDPYLQNGNNECIIIFYAVPCFLLAFWV